MEKEVILFFQQIIKDREKNKKSTRVAQLAGYLANNESIRKWFLKFYSTECEYINFFHQYFRYFNYDNETGFITVNQNMNTKKKVECDPCSLTVNEQAQSDDKLPDD